MEIYSLQRAIDYEKDINWKPGTQKSVMLRDIITTGKKPLLK